MNTNEVQKVLGARLIEVKRVQKKAAYEVDFVFENGLNLIVKNDGEVEVKDAKSVSDKN